MKNSLVHVGVFGVIALGVLGCAEAPKKRSYSPYQEPKTQVREVAPVIKTLQYLVAQKSYTKSLIIIDRTDVNTFTDAERAEFFNLEGLCYSGQNLPLRAEASFRKALRFAQSNEFKAQYRVHLAKSLEQQGRRDESREELEKAEKLATQSNAVRLAVADAKSRLNETSSRNSVKATMSPDQELDGKVSNVSSGVKTDSVSLDPNSLSSGPSDVVKNRIGVLIPLSGKYESFGRRVQRTVELALQKEGKLDQFTLSIVDSGDSVESHAAALKKLIEEEKVMVILGPVLTKGLDMSQKIALNSSIPIIALTPTAGTLNVASFFCSLNSEDQVVPVIRHATEEKNFKRFSILYPKNKQGKELADLFWTEIEKSGGEVKSIESYGVSDTDFRAPVDKVVNLFYPELRSEEVKELAIQRSEMNITKRTMKTAKFFDLPPKIDFDAVIIADEARVSGQVIPTFAYRGAKNLPFIGISSWNSDQLQARAGADVNGAFFPLLSVSDDFKKSYEDVYQVTPNDWDAMAYDAMVFIMKALEQNPSDRKQMIEYLHGFNGTLVGGTGEFQLKDHQCRRTLSVKTVAVGK